MHLPLGLPIDVGQSFGVEVAKLLPTGRAFESAPGATTSRPNATLRFAARRAICRKCLVSPAICKETTMAECRAAGIGCVAVLVSALANPAPAVAALAPASYEEYVGIGGFSAVGSDPGLAESVQLTVAPIDWDDRGGGTGSAAATAVMPVSGAIGLDLIGGTNISGIGGTAYSLTSFQFVVTSLATSERVHISAFGSVTVQSNRPVGNTFARLTTPLVQVEVSNSDAYGSHTGHWEQAWELEGPLATGVSYRLDMYLRSHGEGSGIGYGPDYSFSSRALLDPQISIVGADPSMVHIEFSPGIIVPGIPKTGSGWLLGLGLLTLAWRSGRERTRAQ